jgi:hypothetical protein
LKPELPFGYEVTEWDGTWLLTEHAPTYKPVTGSNNGTVLKKKNDFRTVATFSKDSRVREVERVALWDFMSRRPGISEEDRQHRMRALVKLFGVSVAAVGPGGEE